MTAASTRTLRRDVRYGVGAVARTPQVVAELAGFPQPDHPPTAPRVLLVCGARSFEASGAARMLPELSDATEVHRWSDFAPNTDAADLAQGLRIAAEFRPDLVLGVGGGSAMDMAKLLCAFHHTDPAELPAAIQAGEPVTLAKSGAAAADPRSLPGAGAGRHFSGAGQGAPHLVLVPTTSGSGSEATHFAVVYIGEDKYSVAGEVLRPDVAILDPGLTTSGSAYQRATSGIDAVAQAIESLWAVAATERSRRWARHALNLLLPAIESYVTDPDENSARAMAIGSHLAGRAIDISRTTAAHALSYAITKRHGVSHGHAVALTLGSFVDLHAAAPPDALQASVNPGLHAAIMAELLARWDTADGRVARERFVALLRRLGLEPTLSGVGVRTPEQRRAIATGVNAERLGNNPIQLPAAQISQLIDGID